MSRNISINREKSSRERLERGKRIKQIRQELNMTQIDVSKEFGISKGMVSEYENGKYEPPADLILGLSRKSGRTIAWIMTGQGPEYKENRIKSDALRIKDEPAIKYNQSDSKLKQVMKYLQEHTDLLQSIWQLIQGREGLRKFEKGE